MQYLIYGDLIDSTKQIPDKIFAFWDMFSPINKKEKPLVPLIPILGDAFHGVSANKKEAQALVEIIKTELHKLELKARFVLVPVRGDFSKINTEKKFNKLFMKSCCNPLNVPELVLAHKTLDKIKKSKEEVVQILPAPSLKKRQRFHTIMTREYLNSAES